MPRTIAIAVVILFVVGIGCIFWPDSPPGIATFGGIIAGAALTLGATHTVETWKRNRQATDIAVALYHELANRVARCCFDFESPWIKYHKDPIQMDSFRAGKFIPEEPLIFRSNADKVALLGNQIPSALMAFYYHLWVLERDIVNSRQLTGEIGPNKLKEEFVHVISTRFWATLAPGLKALESMSALVPDWEAIEAAAWDSVDSIVPKRGRTLREHLVAIIGKSESLGIR